MKIEDKSKLIKLLQIKSNDVYINENLKNYTTFKLSNTSCKAIVVCKTEKSLLKTLRILKCQQAFKKEIKTHSECLLLGAGSNIVFKDDFYDNYIIKLGKHFKKIKKQGNFVEVGGGVNLFVLNKFCEKMGLSNLEWSFGIPGTVGGATIMNAGAYGHSFSENVIMVKILRQGEIFWTDNFEFEYRNSSFKKNKDIVLAVKLKLEKKGQEAVKQAMEKYLSQRNLSQPREFSAGSVFKHQKIDGEIIYPAKLIDNLGLKGVKIGDAEISSKHAGFIVNHSNATSRDVLELIDLIQLKVSDSCGITLEPEIEIV